MASQTFTCRWAALSLSNIASVFLPDLLRPKRDTDRIHHTLVCISTTGSKERATTWLKEYKIGQPESIAIYQSYEHMLEDADFDAVYISTPHPLHYKHVKKAIECGRHVLVEKPATMNRAQYAALADLAVAKGVVLMEAMWTRYLPAARYFTDNLLPRIGQVKRVYAEFSCPIVSPGQSHSSRFLDKDAGAGSLLDQGVYALTWADLALAGVEGADGPADTEVVYANAMTVPGVPGDVDDINTVVLIKRERSTRQQQAVGVVTTSMTLPGSSKMPFYQRFQSPKAAPAIRIEATKASVALPFPPFRPQELHVQWYGDEFTGADGKEIEEVIKKPIETGWGTWYQADVFAQRIRDRGTVARKGEVIGGEGSLRVLGWMDQARSHAGIVYNDDSEQLP